MPRVKQPLLMQIHKSVNVTTLCSMFNDMQNYPNMTHICEKLSIIYILIISKYDISTISPSRVWNLTDIGAITLYLKDNKIQHIIIIWTKRRQNVTEKCHKSRSIRYKVHSDHYIQRIFPHYHVNAILFITIKGVHLACFDDQDW